MLNDELAVGSLIRTAYDPDVFHSLAGVWQQKLTAHLRSVTAREGSVLNWHEPAALIEVAETMLHSPATASLKGTFAELLDTTLAAGQSVHHPRYLGHQVPASIPLAGLFDAIGSITNQPMAIYEMGPWATAVERSIVKALQRKVGWNPDSSAGLLTSGGSLANLTALLTARNVVFPDSWVHGLPRNVVLFAQEDAHYCVTRSAGILGLGTARIRKAVLDGRRRMDPDRLNDDIAREKAAGHQILAVAAAACATPIGAFDPLQDIADVCQRHDVWLHVDAAHGGGALMSRRHRSLLAGIERAHSVVWDAHKMMFVPALCAAVLYRDKSHGFATFQQEAPYLFDPSEPGMAEYDLGVSTVECTKRSLGFGLWGVWTMFGETIFEQLIDRTFALTTHLHEMIEATSDFKSLHTPQCNILVFRHLPDDVKKMSPEKQDVFQQTLRTQLIRSGEFYIVQTRIAGRIALRVTVINPLTSRSDLSDLLEAIRETGQRLNRTSAL